MYMACIAINVWKKCVYGNFFLLVRSLVLPVYTYTIISSVDNVIYIFLHWFNIMCGYMNSFRRYCWLMCLTSLYIKKENVLIFIPPTFNIQNKIATIIKWVLCLCCVYRPTPYTVYLNFKNTFYKVCQNKLMYSYIGLEILY